MLADASFPHVCAVVISVAKDTYSCFWRAFLTASSVEAYLVTVGLQGGLRTNQRGLPRVTTQWGGAVFSVSDQRVQRAGLFLDDKELDLLTDLHTETDLGEGCVPVGRQLGLLVVKPSLASWKVVGIFVPPKPCIVMAGFLKVKEENGLTIIYVHKVCQYWCWQETVAYLCTVNLHGQRPSSISASKVSHVTVNRNLLWTKHQRIHLAFGWAVGMLEKGVL